MISKKLSTSIILAAAMLAGSNAEAVSVCIDPGHGGSDPGAVGCNLQEAEINLSVSLKLRKLLEAAGYTVYMTRTTNTDVSLQSRTTYANNKGVTTFASIHTNSASATSATGTETYCYNGQLSNTGGKQAKNIQAKMVAAWGLANRGAKEAGYYVVRYTNMPATLSELAFIVNCSKDAVYLASDAHRNEAAKAHCEALVSQWGGDVGKCSSSSGGGTTPQTGYVKGYVFEGDSLNTSFPKVDGATYTCGGKSQKSSSTTITSFTLPVGSYKCTASKSGYKSNTRSDCAAVTAGGTSWCSINIPKETPVVTTGTATGAVKDSTTGANVVATVSVAGGSSVSYNGSTDWSFTLDAGSYTIKAVANGYDENSVSCKVTANKSVSCPITLNPKKGTLTGSVTDSATGAKVASTIMVGTNTVPYDGNNSWSMTVDAGQYTVNATADGYEMGTTSCSVGRGETATCDIKLTAIVTEEPTPGIVRGTIKDAGTDALIAGTVSVEGTSYASDYSGSGSWQFYLAPGQYSIKGVAEGYESKTVQCASISGEVVSCMLALDPKGLTVKGLVYDGVLNTGVAADVTVTSSSGASKDVSSTADGWSLDLNPGTYTITAKAEGYRDATSTCVVEAGKDVTCKTAIYSNDAVMATLAGTVYDARSEAYLIDAKVTLKDGASVQYAPRSCEEATCKMWRIENVVPGSYSVTAVADGYYENTAQCQAVAVDLEQGVDVIPCKIALTAKVDAGNATNIETGADPIISLMEDDSSCSVGRLATGGSAPWGIFVIMTAVGAACALRRRKDQGE